MATDVGTWPRRFVLAHLFQLVLALDALAAKNTIQIIGLLCFNTLFLAYSIVQASI